MLSVARASWLPAGSGSRAWPWVFLWNTEDTVFLPVVTLNSPFSSPPLLLLLAGWEGGIVPREPGPSRRHTGA